MIKSMGASIMANKTSFSGIERELAHQFREQINTAEDVNAVMDIFARTAKDLLNRAFGDVGTTALDIRFDPSSEKHFKMSEKILNEKKYQDLWEESDIGDIIARFADSSNHRYIHLAKHPERTNLKIRN